MDDSKLERLSRDLEKARKKREEWDSKVKDLEKRYSEAEKLYVYGIFQTAKLTPEELAKLIQGKGNLPSRILGGYGPKAANDGNESIMNEEDTEE